MIDSLFSKKLLTLAELVVAENKSEGRMVATAESCTGGLVSAAITEVSGSSAVLDRAFITYSNDAKTQMLGVDPAIIDQHGAVSLPVAEAMALGAINHSKANLAVSITGVAGPTGGTMDKPIGTVVFALANNQGLIKSEIKQFGENHSRAEIRLQSALFALQWLRI